MTLFRVGLYTQNIIMGYCTCEPVAVLRITHNVILITAHGMKRVDKIEIMTAVEIVKKRMLFCKHSVPSHMGHLQGMLEP